MSVSPRSTPALALEQASLFGLDPVRAAMLAADLGCDHLTIALSPGRASLAGHAPWSLREDAALRRELAAVLADRGISLSCAEGIAILPGQPVSESDLALLAELGAPRINVVSLDPDLPRTLDRYGELTALAAAYGLTTLVEFVPIFTVKTLAMARQVVAHVGRPDCRIMFDCMHFARTGGTLAQLAAPGSDDIGYVQLCDVPLEPVIPDYMEEAVCQRRIPGEGELPLADWLAVLPQTCIFGLEVPLRAEMLAGESDRSRLGRAVEATRALLG